MHAQRKRKKTFSFFFFDVTDFSPLFSFLLVDNKCTKVSCVIPQCSVSQPVAVWNECQAVFFRLFNLPALIDWAACASVFVSLSR